MDGISALGAAGAVLQFIDFDRKVFSTAREINASKQGRTRRNKELNPLIKETEWLSDSLKDRTPVLPSHKGTSPDVIFLKELTTKCREECKKLRQELVHQIPQDSKSKVSVSVAALKGIWNEKKIKSMEQSIVGIRQRVNEALVLALAQSTSGVYEALQTLSQRHSTLGIRSDNRIDAIVHQIIMSAQGSDSEQTVLSRLQELEDEYSRLFQGQRLLESLNFPELHT